MEKKELLYEGKAKQVYATEDPNLIIMHYKDDATAGNGLKHAQFAHKGELNNAISTKIYHYLIDNGVKTHYVETLNDTDQLCKKVDIFPLEVIVRNVIAGSMAKRLGIKEGTKPSNTIFEICGAATYEELAVIYKEVAKINQLLINLFDKASVKLIDFKVEFGKTKDGEIVLADEISPDCCRLWDKETNDHLDKDRFRRDLGDVMGAYVEILNRLNNIKE